MHRWCLYNIYQKFLNWYDCVFTCVTRFQEIRCIDKCYAFVVFSDELSFDHFIPIIYDLWKCEKYNLLKIHLAYSSVSHLYRACLKDDFIDFFHLLWISGPSPLYLVRSLNSIWFLGRYSQKHCYHKSLLLFLCVTRILNYVALSNQYYTVNCHTCIVTCCQMIYNNSHWAIHKTYPSLPSPTNCTESWIMLIFMIIRCVIIMIT